LTKASTKKREKRKHKECQGFFGEATRRKREGEKP